MDQQERSSFIIYPEPLTEGPEDLGHCCIYPSSSREKKTQRFSHKPLDNSQGPLEKILQWRRQGLSVLIGPRASESPSSPAGTVPVTVQRSHSWEHFVFSLQGWSLIPFVTHHKTTYGTASNPQPRPCIIASSLGTTGSLWVCFH